MRAFAFLGSLSFVLCSVLAAPAARAQDAPAELAQPSVPPAYEEAQVPEPAPAPPPPPAVASTSLLGDDEFLPEPDPALRLEAWLTTNADRMRMGRIAVGVISLIGGAVALGATIFTFQADDPIVRAVAAPLLAFTTVLYGTLGIAFLTTTTPQEDRLDRWKRARARGTTELDVASFAGEFFAEADQARYGRELASVLGFGMALGGGTMMLLGGTADADDEARAAMLLFGAALALPGILTGILSLVIESPIEQDWRRYQQGLRPRDVSRRSVTLGPMVADGGGGVALAAQL